MKKGPLPPLLGTEMEPGQAIQYLLSIDHPLLAPAELAADVRAILYDCVNNPEALVEERAAAVQHWTKFAEDTKMQALDELNNIQDIHLRRLYSHNDMELNSTRQVGSFVHFPLYRAMAAAAQSLDPTYPDELKHGMKIIGPVARSGRWEPRALVPFVSEAELDRRAWDIRKTVLKGVRRKAMDEAAQKVWEATLQDCEDGHSVGPFFRQQQVTDFLGTDVWIPTERFARIQKNKVRGVDSATINDINAAAVSENLMLTSTDQNVGTILELNRLAKAHGKRISIEGWVLDEENAYRQIGVDPLHRRFAVVSLRAPGRPEPAFVIMIGHSFGVVAAVYNYNRRSALINEILQKLFRVAANFFYDDKFGFEPRGTATSAHHTVQQVHTLLGAKFAPKKLQRCRNPVILGIEYDLEGLKLEVTEARRQSLSMNGFWPTFPAPWGR
jgi:hypothetical protein